MKVDLRSNGDAGMLSLDATLLNESSLQEFIDLGSNESLFAERETSLCKALEALSPQEHEALQMVVVISERMSS